MFPERHDVGHCKVQKSKKIQPKSIHTLLKRDHSHTTITTSASSLYTKSLVPSSASAKLPVEDQGSIQEMVYARRPEFFQRQGAVGATKAFAQDELQQTPPELGQFLGTHPSLE